MFIPVHLWSFTDRTVVVCGAVDVHLGDATVFIGDCLRRRQGVQWTVGHAQVHLGLPPQPRIARFELWNVRTNCDDCHRETLANSQTEHLGEKEKTEFSRRKFCKPRSNEK